MHLRGVPAGNSRCIIYRWVGVCLVCERESKRNSDYYFIVEPEAEVKLLGDFAKMGWFRSG
jgi:hypothetical protein